MPGHIVSEPISRRHLLKAAAIVAGSLTASLSKAARAQQGGGGDDQGGNSQGWDCQDGNSQGRWRCCFLRGTLIRTAGGYRPIETLALGDPLPTRFSGMAAIQRIINFTVRQDEHGRWPDDRRLVRVSAGAFDDGVPVRDLFLSHTHEVFLNGVLIPIASLVNGKTICFHDAIDSAEYFHVEFAFHDVIEAEGALCESSRDEAMERCAPVALNGGSSQLWSHLRSAAAPFVDRRKPFDLIRDSLEARAGILAAA